MTAVEATNRLVVTWERGFLWELPTGYDQLLDLADLVPEGSEWHVETVR